MDGKYTLSAELQKGTDWIVCKCVLQVFSVVYVVFDDYENGVVIQCQECCQILEVWKE